MNFRIKAHFRNILLNAKMTRKHLNCFILHYNCNVKNVKSFPSLTAYRASLVSVSEGPQPDTSFYTARRIRG